MIAAATRTLSKFRCVACTATFPIEEPRTACEACGSLLDVSPDLLRRQITLIGSWTFSTQGQADCAEFVADHNVAVDKLFTHRWRLDQAEEAYRVFDSQTTGKGVIMPS